MKKQFQFLVIILMITFIQSCVPEDSVTPDTGDVRDKYTGTWLVIEHARKSSLIVTYTIVISLDPSNSSRVLLSHFSGYSGSNPAYGIATSSSITVTSQSMASDWQVEGSGTLANSITMDWSYTITAGGNTDTFTATATKQ